jgi:hypothetical protein
MSSMRKLWQLSWRDRTLLVEATVWVAVSSFLVAALPFRQVAAIACRSALRAPLEGASRQAIVSGVQWAIATASAHVPWRAVCFQQGLAAQLMLRRRGVQSVLYYGASQRPITGLAAHVWVRAGDLDVVGCETASQYALLASFPTTMASG